MLSSFQIPVPATGSESGSLNARNVKATVPDQRVRQDQAISWHMVAHHRSLFVPESGHFHMWSHGFSLPGLSGMVPGTRHRHSFLRLEGLPGGSAGTCACK